VLPAAVDRFTEVWGHPAAEWSIASDVQGGLAYVRAIGGELEADPQEVHVTSQVPPNAGISSSAALLVAVAAGLKPDMDGKQAALACQRAEQRATGVQVGVMDQFASALGRRGNALLLDCATLEYELVPFPEDVAIAVIDSGEHRSLASTPYNQRRREGGTLIPRSRAFIHSSRRCTIEMCIVWAGCSWSRIRACATISKSPRQLSTPSSSGRTRSTGALARASWARASAAASSRSSPEARRRALLTRWDVRYFYAPRLTALT
jgi:hypothetical protein